MQMNGAAIGAEDAGYGLHEGRLAGAVVADQRQDLAGREIEVDIVDRDEAAEALDHAATGEDGSGLRHGRSAHRAILSFA